MAQKRMFSLHIVDTDKFMDMSTSAQALYFHLGMHGDDDGFVASPRKIARSAGCNDDDMRLLAAKGFIIPMDSGVVVITDWKVNNTIKSDRYSPTIYQRERELLQVDSTGRYQVGTQLEPECVQDGFTVESQYSIDKYSIDKGSKVDKPPRSSFIPPTVEQVREYICEKGYSVDAERFVDYYTSNGWMVGKNKMKDWKAAVRTWSKGEVQKPSGRNACNPSGQLGVAELEAIQRVLNDNQ